MSTTEMIPANYCFRFPSMFESVGTAASSGVAAALIMGTGFIPIALMQWQGEKWYKRSS